ARHRALWMVRADLDEPRPLTPPRDRLATDGHAAVHPVAVSVPAARWWDATEEVPRKPAHPTSYPPSLLSSCLSSPNDGISCTRISLSASSGVAQAASTMSGDLPGHTPCDEGGDQHHQEGERDVERVRPVVGFPLRLGRPAEDDHPARAHDRDHEVGPASHTALVLFPRRGGTIP